MSTPYRSDYAPSFPALHVTVHGEHGQHAQSALIDTGADATLIPLALLENIDAVESGWALLRTRFGERRQVQKYLVDLRFGQATIPGLHVVADEYGDEIILGRDVLNRLPLFMDGLGQQTDLLDEAAAQRLRAQRQTTS